MSHTDDPYRDFLNHEAEKERWLQSRPVCSECEEHIQDDECFEIGGELICPDCLIKNHRKWTDNLS